jgi:hypothetical protein
VPLPFDVCRMRRPKRSDDRAGCRDLCILLALQPDPTATPFQLLSIPHLFGACAHQIH